MRTLSVVDLRPQRLPATLDRDEHTRRALGARLLAALGQGTADDALRQHSHIDRYPGSDVHAGSGLGDRLKLSLREVFMSFRPVTRVP